MEFEEDQNSKNLPDLVAEMIDHLTENGEIVFKSQQRDEDCLGKSEKAAIAMGLFEKSKTNFLCRFGRYLKAEHLELLRRYEEDDLAHLVADFEKSSGENRARVRVRNRRYEALKRLTERDDEYFTEVAMMKRNPLLYEQLVGQYLTEKEKVERDKQAASAKGGATLVNILLEGIEREEAEVKRRAQEDDETPAAPLKSEDGYKISSFAVEPQQEPCVSHWGEIKPNTTAKKRKHQEAVFVTAGEKRLFKEEFITTMYHSFLSGQDADFDYNTVDNNDFYDNIEELSHDEEEKYFDSEEPENVNTEEDAANESSEDELDIYMNALNQHPAVCQLSKNLEKL